MTEPIRVPDGREVFWVADVDWEMLWHGDAYVRVDAVPIESLARDQRER